MPVNGVKRLKEYFFSISLSDARSRRNRTGRTVCGEAEKRTLVNLIQAIDKDHILLSSDTIKKPSFLIAKLEIWEQVMEAFTEVTGKKSSLFKLQGILKRMKLRENSGKYLDYDEDLGKWKFLN